MKSSIFSRILLGVALLLTSTFAFATNYVYLQSFNPPSVFTAASGNTYVPNANGIIAVPYGVDVADAVKFGFIPFEQVYTAYAAVTTTTTYTATAANLLGNGSATGFVILDFTGTLLQAHTATTPTATALLAQLPDGGRIGETFYFRVINDSSGNFAWTISGGTGVTINGTSTVAKLTWRDYSCNVAATGTPAITCQSVGVGTNS